MRGQDEVEMDALNSDGYKRRSIGLDLPNPSRMGRAHAPFQQTVKAPMDRLSCATLSYMGALFSLTATVYLVWIDCQPFRKVYHVDHLAAIEIRRRRTTRLILGAYLAGWL